jgi:hypothetical protein
MTTGDFMNEPPSFLSWNFHTVFFPRLLCSRLRGMKKEGGAVSFGGHMELTVVLFVCLAALAFGARMAVGRNSLAGWILVTVGAAGSLFIFVSSVVARRGARLTYDGFLIWIFFFFVFLGLTAGLYWGLVNHFSRGVGIGADALGLMGGYVAGIGMGRWAQNLGWVSRLLDGFAGLAIIGLLVADMLLLVE